MLNARKPQLVSLVIRTFFSPLDADVWPAILSSMIHGPHALLILIGGEGLRESLCNKLSVGGTVLLILSL